MKSLIHEINYNKFHLAKECFHINKLTITNTLIYDRSNLQLKDNVLHRIHRKTNRKIGQI